MSLDGGETPERALFCPEIQSHLTTVATSLLGRCGRARASSVRLVSITVLGLALLGAVGWYLSVDRFSWAALAVGTYLSVIGYAMVRVDGNGSVGIANTVTLFRGLLIAVVAGFIVASPGWMWLPATVFSVAALLDGIDGAIARRTRTSKLGAQLDHFVDALAILVGGGAAVALAGLPAWYLTAGVLWFAYAGAIFLRKRRGQPIYELPESRHRRPVGIAQLLVIAIGLSPFAPHVGLSIAAGAALIGLVGSFLRDWASVTGRTAVFASGRSVRSGSMD